jgi:hypothetical protein
MLKTVFITISRGGTARNILQTDAYKALKDAELRIVILTPAFQDERFVAEFAAPNVFFENLPEPKWTVLDKFLVGWHKALVYNDSTKRRDLYGIYNPEEGSFLKYFFKKVFFGPLSRLQFLKKFFKCLDAVLIKDKYYKEVFDKYKPDLVFAASAIEDTESFVLKQARSRKIKTVGMAKSWDNLSKISFRAMADKFIVWGDCSKEESVRFQNYSEKDIIICGVPQFDFYKNDEFLMEREEFCRLYGIPGGKKIIVFCSEGKITLKDGEITEIIADFINKGSAGETVLLIRPHFMYQGDEKKFAAAAKLPNVYLDSGYNPSSIFRDRWDYSKEQIKKFTNIMRYADLVITTASTISLDAAAFDKPIINIVFDGREKLPFRNSVARWYINEHYKHVAETGAVWLVDSKEELLNAINGYLGNPNLLVAGRERLRNYFCYKIDGGSGRRIAEVILENL